MKRHAAKHLPKHVRRARARLLDLGMRGIAVTISGRCYRMDWAVGRETLRCTASLSSSGNAFERLWATIRALFRARGLEVPA